MSFYTGGASYIESRTNLCSRLKALVALIRLNRTGVVNFGGKWRGMGIQASLRCNEKCTLTGITWNKDSAPLSPKWTRFSGNLLKLGFHGLVRSFRSIFRCEVGED